MVGVDVHLEVGLDILQCKPQHLSGVFPQVSHQLSNLGPVRHAWARHSAASFFAGELYINSVCCKEVEPGRDRSESVCILMVQLCVCLADIHFAASHIGPIRTLESQFFDDQVDTDSGIGPLHDPTQDCHGLHVMKVWPEDSPHFGFVLVVEDFCHVLELRVVACDREIVSVDQNSHVPTGMIVHARVALLPLEIYPF